MLLEPMSQERLMQRAAERLERKSVRVPFSGCQIWMGCTNEHGYGLVGVGTGKGSTRRAHRVAYELAYGPIPDGPGYHGMEVRHRCDTPACINPNHLELGAHADNMQDTAKRNRNRFGSRHHGAVLSESDVAQILALKGKQSQTKTAEQFGVYQSVISRIYSGKAWRRAAQGEML